MISLLDFVWHRYNYLWIQMASESVSMLQDAFDIQDWREPLSFLPSVVGMELYFVSGIVGCSEFAFGQPITSIEVFLQVINLFWVSKFEGFRVPATDISYCEGWLFSGCKFHIQKPTNGCLFMYILFV